MREDFDRAIAEVKPSFGVATDDFENCAPNGIVPFSAAFEHTLASCRAFVEQVHHSRRTPLVSVLLDGNRGSGKTALAATIALQSGFPFVKLVTPDQLVGYGESGRVDALVQAFNDAYKSPMSVLVIDDIERLIEYVPSVPARFSNAVLQALAVLLRRTPPKNRRLIVIGTCANRRALEELQLGSAFDAVLQMPEISSPAELREFLTHRSIAEFEDSEADLERVVRAFPSRLPDWRQEAHHAARNGAPGLQQRRRRPLHRHSQRFFNETIVQICSSECACECTTFSCQVGATRSPPRDPPAGRARANRARRAASRLLRLSSCAHP
jgi:SpoVK/Ycf46/Vps4 family AAA+-type ATPase